MLRTVLLVNYSEQPITKHEQKLIEERLGTKEVDYIVSHPKSIEEHLKNCLDIEPDLVLFGITKCTLFEKAIGEGYLHVAVDPLTSSLKKVTSLRPQLEEIM